MTGVQTCALPICGTGVGHVRLEAILMKTKVLSQYMNEEGVLVTVYTPKRILSSERTWKMVKGSIANMGAQAVKLSAIGLHRRKHG